MKIVVAEDRSSVGWELNGQLPGGLGRQAAQEAICQTMGESPLGFRLRLFRALFLCPTIRAQRKAEGVP